MHVHVCALTRSTVENLHFADPQICRLSQGPDGSFLLSDGRVYAWSWGRVRHERSGHHQHHGARQCTTSKGWSGLSRTRKTDTERRYQLFKALPVVDVHIWQALLANCLLQLP